jgi:hypothetical protein
MLLTYLGVATFELGFREQLLKALSRERREGLRLQL